jgi:hypothetical protein
MKKVLLLVFVALLISGRALPQKGEIIYAEFKPDSTVHYFNTENIIMPKLLLDMDYDGTEDFKFTCEESYHLMLTTVLRGNPAWRFRLPYQIFHQDDAVPIVGDTLREGDTISNITGGWTPAYRFQYNRYNTQYPYQQVCPNPDSHYYISVRHEVEGGFCYGWIDSHISISEDPVVNGSFNGQEIYVTIFRMAYCTIPNYPLCIGQTSFDWGVEENGTMVFATIHPNPTTGKVTVMGKDLKAAEVINMFGQRMTTAQGKGETLQIDIANLPAGVYFVNITDETGRKCVKKVVKE